MPKDLADGLSSLLSSTEAPVSQSFSAEKNGPDEKKQTSPKVRVNQAETPRGWGTGERSALS